MLTRPYQCPCQCVHTPAMQLWIVRLCCCRCSLELHTQRFNPTALMIVWLKHWMCGKNQLEQRPSVVGECCSVWHRSPSELKDSLPSGWECCPLQLCTVRHLQEPSLLKGAVFPQLRPLSLGRPTSHNWSTQEWKDPAFLPQFGNSSELLVVGQGPRCDCITGTVLPLRPHTSSLSPDRCWSSEAPQLVFCMLVPISKSASWGTWPATLNRSGLACIQRWYVRNITL